MPRVMALIKRLPTLDRRAFREHYEERHTVVARPLLRHLVEYARHHVEEEVVGPIGFDVLTAFRYRSLEAIGEMFATLASEAATPILEDERRFMDKPANRFFQVSRRTFHPGAGDVAEPERSLFVLVARPPSMPRWECSGRLVQDHWPALLADRADAARAILRDAFPMREVPPPFDGLLQLPAEAEVDVPGFAKRLGGEGYRVVAVRTRKYETALPAA